MVDTRPSAVKTRLENLLPRRDVQNGPLTDHTSDLGTHKFARVTAHHAPGGRPFGSNPSSHRADQYLRVGLLRSDREGSWLAASMETNPSHQSAVCRMLHSGYPMLRLVCRWLLAGAFITLATLSST